MGQDVCSPLSVVLAFLFGHTLSSRPLLRSGLALGAALRLVPGAMNAGLVNAVFWVGMSISLVAAFFAAYPVNRYLLARGRGHALRHEQHGGSGPVIGARRFIPVLPTSALAAAIAAFVVGGFVVAVADGLASPMAPPAHTTTSTR
ncbi:DUF4396 domain-containing protein [Terrabacter sp. 2YAF2]|uniref:DUF4396 domain-containing protein n=1 Tax=Terrabacter sp. 2YAF2 TaxID=3233026 RepID=UPI003F970020